MHQVNRIAGTTNERDPRRAQYSTTHRTSGSPDKHQQDTGGAQDRIEDTKDRVEQAFSRRKHSLDRSGEQKSRITNRKSQIVATPRQLSERLSCYGVVAPENTENKAVALGKQAVPERMVPFENPVDGLSQNQQCQAQNSTKINSAVSALDPEISTKQKWS